MGKQVLSVQSVVFGGEEVKQIIWRFICHDRHSNSVFALNDLSVELNSCPVLNRKVSRNSFLTSFAVRT